jgi:DNA-binding NarL/FixJ family response regulator
MPTLAPVYIGEGTAAPSQKPNEVVVMEDDNSIRQYVVDALKLIGIRARTVSDAKEAVDIAKKKLCHYYILDVNMGRRKSEEGLDALEKIKKFDPNSFVAVYSNHKDKLQKAIRLGADVSKEKSESQIKDMTSIVLQMMAPCLATRPEDLIRSILGQKPQNESNGDDQPVSDKNIEAYKAYILNPEWVNDHEGKYVAFVNGKLIGEGDDRASLLQRMREQYSGVRILFTRVRGEKEVVRLLTPQIFTK